MGSVVSATFVGLANYVTGDFEALELHFTTIDGARAQIGVRWPKSEVPRFGGNPMPNFKEQFVDEALKSFGCGFIETAQGSIVSLFKRAGAFNAFSRIEGGPKFELGKIMESASAPAQAQGAS